MKSTVKLGLVLISASSLLFLMARPDISLGAPLEQGPAMFGYVRVTPDNEVITQASPADELDNPPRLIGIGCKGAQGPLWADEEDDFPGPCDSISLIPMYQDDRQQPD